MKKTSSQRSKCCTQVDEHVVRLNGLITIILVLAGLFNPEFWLLLVIDLALRGFTKFSPVAYFSRSMVSVLGLKPIMIAAAPKKFAAQIALTLMVFVLVFTYFELSLGVTICVVALLTALSLATFFNYCFACTLYPLFSALRK